MRMNDRIRFGGVEPICGLGLVRRLKDAGEYPADLSTPIEQGLLSVPRWRPRTN